MPYGEEKHMKEIRESLLAKFDMESLIIFEDNFKRKMTQEEAKVISEFIEDRVQESLEKCDKEIEESLMDLEFDISDMQDIDEFEKELEETETSSFGFELEENEEENDESTYDVVESDELDWDEA